MRINSSRYGAAALGLCLAFARRRASRRASNSSSARRSSVSSSSSSSSAAAGAAAGRQQRVELKPTQPEWTKVCGNDQAAGKEICYTTRDFGQGADQAPVLAVAVYDVKGDAQRIVRLLLPVGLLLRPGFRFSIDKGASLEGAYEICFPNGCFAEVARRRQAARSHEARARLNINVKNQVNSEVVFAVPLEGFGKAFDGPAIDPKVLEEQQTRPSGRTAEARRGRAPPSRRRGSRAGRACRARGSRRPALIASLIN